MSSLDKALRITVALVFIFLSYTQVVTGFVSGLLLVLAFILLLTSLANFCPIYFLFRINTREVKKV